MTESTTFPSSSLSATHPVSTIVVGASESQEIHPVETVMPSIVPSEDFSFVDLFFGDASTQLPVHRVGGKAANLWALTQMPDLLIPVWCVLGSHLFEQYLNDIGGRGLVEELDRLCGQEPDWSQIEAKAKQIRECISGGNLSISMMARVIRAVTNLQQKMEQGASLAVRSSGVLEDAATSSCAGLYDSHLNVRGVDRIVEAIKAVWASSFSDRVVRERCRLRVAQTQCAMGVILQAQVDPYAAGVVSTSVLSNGYPGCEITANYGLGESVVSGESSADSWVLHATGQFILEEVRGGKAISSVLSPEGGTRIAEVEKQHREQFVLTAQQVKEIGRHVAAIRERYGCQVDVEYAIDKKGQVRILQARPLVSVATARVVDSKEGEFPVIGRGLYSVPGVASGRLVYIPSLGSLESGEIRLHEGDIALAYVTTNSWCHYLDCVAGIITREGSPSAHPILLSREKCIPCVIGVHDDFETLLNCEGKFVSIDGFSRTIYEGKVPTRQAVVEDLQTAFAPPKFRAWPSVESDLPHLLHNGMVVQHDGKYWRRTPTYRVTGFQRELNMLRFEKLPLLIGRKEAVVSALEIDGYSCCELTPFETYVALLGQPTVDAIALLNQRHESCTKEFMSLAHSATDSSDSWRSYIDAYACFRAYIFLGGAIRAYAERKVDDIAIECDIPALYLESCAAELQGAIPEIDAEMRSELARLARLLKDKNLPESIEELEEADPHAYTDIVTLSRKYRFEHNISLDVRLDLALVYRRVLQEVVAVRQSRVTPTPAAQMVQRSFLPEHLELREWLRLSIWNRILQSDGHHMDAAAKMVVRPKLLELGTKLVQKGVLYEPSDIFRCSVNEISTHIGKSKEV